MVLRVSTMDHATIVRFVPVYYFHFKCNLDSIRGGAFPNLHRWLREMYWKNAAFQDTTDFTSIKDHYFASHLKVNPTGIVPVGPCLLYTSDAADE